LKPRLKQNALSELSVQQGLPDGLTGQNEIFTFLTVVALPTSSQFFLISLTAESATFYAPVMTNLREFGKIQEILGKCRKIQKYPK
jgi:hypothetical protein